MKSKRNRMARLLLAGVMTFALVFALPFGVAGLFADDRSDVTSSLPIMKSVRDAFDANVYAASKSWTVKFSGNGGKASKASKKVKSGKKYGTLPTATRTGYKFAGWYTDKTYGSKITKNTKVKAKYKRLYAHWTPRSYTMSFDANGGSVYTRNKIVTYGSSYGVLPSASLAGHTFMGWFTARSGGYQVTSYTIKSAAGNFTVYAQWSASSYTVSFDARGGSVSPSSKKVQYGSPYGTLPTPTRSNYVFAGWFMNRDATGAVAPETTMGTANNHTLYAAWNAIPSYKVYFDANGGEVSTESITRNNGDTYGTLPVPTRKEYNFVGWWTSPDGGERVTAVSVVALNGDTTLYAHWEIKPETCLSDLTRIEWTGDEDAWKYTVSVGSPVSDNHGTYYYKGAIGNYGVYVLLSPSTVTYDIGGAYRRFSGIFGLRSNSVEEKHSPVIRIYGDGNLLYTSPPMIKGMRVVPFSIDITGVREFNLSYSGVPDGNDTTDWTYWVIFDPTLIR